LAHRIHRGADQVELLGADHDVELGELIDQHFHAQAPLVEAVDVVVDVAEEIGGDAGAYSLKGLTAEIDLPLVRMHRRRRPANDE
jgi:hypothetical protein